MDTFYNARSCRTSRSIPSCGSEQGGNSGLFPKAGSKGSSTTLYVLQTLLHIPRADYTVEQPKTAEQKDHIRTRLVKREEAKRAKLRDLGIEYDFDGYAKSLPSKQAKDEKELQKANKAAKKLEDQVKKDASDAEKKGKNGKAETKKEPARASKRARKVNRMHRLFSIYCG